jgi:hypothetical protein
MTTKKINQEESGSGDALVSKKRASKGLFAVMFVSRVERDCRGRWNEVMGRRGLGLGRRTIEVRIPEGLFLMLEEMATDQSYYTCLPFWHPEYLPFILKLQASNISSQASATRLTGQ